MPVFVQVVWRTCRLPGDEATTKQKAAHASGIMDAMHSRNDTFQPRRRWPRRLAWALVTVAVILFAGVAAFAIYASDYYRDADTTRKNLVSSAALPVAQGDGYLAFGDPNAATGIVLYPGAKVEYSAYAPLMRFVAEHGYLAVAVEMPFNFAFFDIDAADRVRAAYPQVDTWWIGGHSLGGSMAAQYAADHADDVAIEGLVLLGAYTASDLSDADLGAVTVYGSNDLILDRDKLAEGATKLPEGAKTVVIEGGNHAGFGDYGPQKGDGEATLPPDDQQKQTADVLAASIEDRESHAKASSAAA